MSKIDPDDWEVWRAHPLTRRLFNGFDAWAADSKAAWVQVSWDAGQLDAKKHALLFARAEAFRQLAELTREQLEEQEP